MLRGPVLNRLSPVPEQNINFNFKLEPFDQIMITSRSVSRHLQASTRS